MCTSSTLSACSVKRGTLINVAPGLMEWSELCATNIPTILPIRIHLSHTLSIQRKEGGSLPSAQSELCVLRS